MFNETVKEIIEKMFIGNKYEGHCYNHTHAEALQTANSSRPDSKDETANDICLMMMTVHYESYDKCHWHLQGVSVGPCSGVVMVSY